MDKDKLQQVAMSYGGIDCSTAVILLEVLIGKGAVLDCIVVSFSSTPDTTVPGTQTAIGDQH